MSQFQPNAAPGKSFIEKINSKFSSLSVSNSLPRSADKDGSTDEDTLIHKAFVKFFDANGEPYPEWLGVKNASATSRQLPYSSARHSGGSSQFQPVRASYNSADLRLSTSPQQMASHSRLSSAADSASEERPTARRSNSRLQAMYNKTRQQSVPGSGYTVQLLPSTSVTSRTTSSSLRLRDRVVNGSLDPSSSSRANWGR